MTDLSQTIEDIKVIEAAGCVPFPKHIDLCVKRNKGSGVFECRVWDSERASCVYNDEACHDAIIAWCGDVRVWWQKSQTESGSTLNPYGEMWSWHIFSQSCFIAEIALTQLLACIALISAVAKRLGEG